MEDIANQAAGELAVFYLRDGAEGAGKAKATRQDLGELDWGSGDQPHLLAGGQMHLSELRGAGVRAAGEGGFDDFLAEIDKLVHAAAFDKLQCLRAAGGDVLCILCAGDAEFKLLPGNREYLRDADVASAGEPKSEFHQGGTLNEGIVHVEKGGGAHVDGDVRILGRDALGACGVIRTGDGGYAGGEVLELEPEFL